MSKRYHYDKRGRYKGYSTSTKDNTSFWALIIAIIIICNIFGGC